MLPDTADATSQREHEEGAPTPGVVVVFSGASSMFLPFTVGTRPLVVGRAGAVGALLPDERLSRQHAEIRYRDGTWVIRDLGSRNGTFVDGVPVDGEMRVTRPRVIRAADTVLVPCADTACMQRPAGAPGELLAGWKLGQALGYVRRAAVESQTLLVLGESGTGKELAARTFHTSGPHAAGPFVAVNCAAIPRELAERLLFGTKRGAYSGADTEAVGHVQAADRGVLFLDEAAELDLQVQAKLLRVLETGEVVPLGASTGKRVALRVCLATNGDVRAAVAAGSFRADLYYRIAPPEIVLPPLRERLDEIAGHVAAEIACAAPQLGAHAKLIEACILRPWPGNVRELRKQIRHAAMCAQAEVADRVRLEHLPPRAGESLTAAEQPMVVTHAPSSAPPAPRRPYVRWSAVLTREDVQRALSESAGNVARAARLLDMPRPQFYREMARFDIKPRPDHEGSA